MNALRPTRRQRGLTLIESCTVLVIVGVVLGISLPSFRQARERRELEGMAAQLRTDLAHARSLAVARNENVRVDFSSPGCYVVHSGAAGACTCGTDGSASCKGEAVLMRQVTIDRSTGITLSSNNASMQFDAGRGTVSPTGTLKLATATGAAIHSVVNVMGRVRNCSPAPALPGYATC